MKKKKHRTKNKNKSTKRHGHSNKQHSYKEKNKHAIKKTALNLNLFKNIWFWLFVAAVLIFNFSFFNLSNTNKLLTKEINQLKKEQQLATTPKETSKAPKDTIAFSKKGAIKPLEININDVKSETEIKESEFKTYKSESGQYAMVNITIKNTGNNTESINANNFTLVSKDKKEYTPSILAGLTNKYITFESMNPDLSVSGFLVFEIPKDTEITSSTLHVSFKNNSLAFSLKK
ncbi:DUF4352 domain-containing protein [Vagococcus vulneris]|uniref:DUF4352 domain-containing protein n=1 Tax=Vagococcus vulneris TaxID=1977869 RepID=UPI00140231EA|nr:DUF4352 domain-containing protein [Vagococcus vulneris]